VTVRTPLGVQVLLHDCPTAKQAFADVQETASSALFGSALGLGVL
jgi:hypothetical protein